MSYEDVIRVADLKSRRSRVARIRSESRAREGEILEVVEYLRPGVDEVAAILPRALGARLRDWATRHGRLETLNRGMHLPSTRIHGYLMLRLLARPSFLGADLSGTSASCAASGPVTSGR